jgi:hypothetical protein
LTLLFAMGCASDCVDCVQAITELGVFRGDGATLTSVQDARGGDALYAGGTASGDRWALHMGAGHLLAGTPFTSEVLSVDFRTVGDALLADALFGSLIGEEAEDRFGSALATSDGLLWVGAEYRDVGRGRPDAGGAYLFSELGTGWTGERLASDADLVVLGEQPYQHVGSVVQVCEDLDGDGLEDLLVTAGWDHTGANLGGRVFAVLSTERDELTREVLVGGLSTSWWSTDEGALLGRSLGCLDVDGDGIQEALLGAPYADGLAGDATGAVYAVSVDQPGVVEEAALVVFEGVAEQSYLGWSMAVGDLDSDGELELVAGAPGAVDGFGAVGVYVPSGGLRTIFRGTEAGRFGEAVRLADLDGDGTLDLVVGAPRVDTVWLYSGANSASWPRVVDDVDAEAAVAGTGAGSRLAVGDLDGDGDDDLVLALETSVVE